MSAEAAAQEETMPSVAVHELRVPLYVETPKGDALCYFLIWLHQDHDLLFVCFIEETRQCWTFRNPEIRLCWNYTMALGRRPNEKFPQKPRRKREGSAVVVAENLAVPETLPET